VWSALADRTIANGDPALPALKALCDALMSAQTTTAGPSRPQPQTSTDDERSPLLARSDSDADVEAQAGDGDGDGDGDGGGVPPTDANSMATASWLLCYVSSTLLVVQIVVLCLYTFRPSSISGMYSYWSLPDAWTGLFGTVCRPPNLILALSRSLSGSGRGGRKAGN
jgi:hypothetical protein